MLSLNKSYTNPFQSFWMGGYECTDKLNAFGNRVDFLSLTGHLQKIDEDYKDLSTFAIKTVREGIRWSQVEKQPYQYDWSVVERMIASGKKAGIQQVWDICHFGYPDDLTPLHPMFARRFASLCRAFVQFYRSVDPHGTLIVTPINEVGFISWLGGDAGGTVPYTKGYGWEVKYALMQAYIEGVEALREEDASIRILTTEPLVNIVPPLNASADELATSIQLHEIQYQVLDILSGRMCPELRGKPEYLDILGFNFYYNNQWVSGTSNFLPWFNEIPDERWRPLSSLLREAFQRYHRPLVLSETSHPGIDRPKWIRFIGDHCTALIESGIPLWGVCWYPVIDRPDWDHLHPWHQAGLWDVLADNELHRVLHQPSAEVLVEVQSQVQNALNHQKQLAGESRTVTTPF